MLYVLNFSATYHHDYLGITHYSRNVHAPNAETYSNISNSIEFSDAFLGIGANLSYSFREFLVAISPNRKTATTTKNVAYDIVA